MSGNRKNGYNVVINVDKYTRNMKQKKDTLYQDVQGQIKPFEFDERVADVFPDMISRSVPGYAQTISMLSVIAEEYAKEGSQVYDLGCSLGVATLALGQSIQGGNCKIIAVDNSLAMINRCEKNLERAYLTCPVDVIHADIRDVSIENASIVVMNFTLQFLPQDERTDLIKSIYYGLNPGGVLILSEKIQMENDEENELMIKLHHQFKRLNGYDDMEISGKRTALENVLVPETLEKHQQRISQAGFAKSTVWMQCLNFVSILAKK